MPGRQVSTYKLLVAHHGSYLNSGLKFAAAGNALIGCYIATLPAPKRRHCVVTDDGKADELMDTIEKEVANSLIIANEETFKNLLPLLLGSLKNKTNIS